jgi:hypothetical protein
MRRKHAPRAPRIPSLNCVKATTQMVLTCPKNKHLYSCNRWHLARRLIAAQDVGKPFREEFNLQQDLATATQLKRQGDEHGYTQIRKHQ